ncbi:MAG TPA: hypothetical protein H9754_13255 [Candidatus Anaerostipes avistercoris]|uniref:Uncharacterized protein n=1 Tax=Candidatus Anaerostipes avistercoris TaxID=2838462 RepID=A0A9D2PLA9_9FIRM|nr:hypothetical protein [uncultured Anaerostipes sp.]HJC51515.1 hypothetical protein [Candidatus Anaerostipes avistercoris]
MERKNTFLKVMSVIILIQGILQILNVVIVVSAGMQADVSSFMYYAAVVLSGLYGLAAVAGGLTGFRFGNALDGCRRSFYYGVTLLVVVLLMIIVNGAAGAFDLSQIGSFFLPAMFTAAAVMGGRQ